MGINMSEPDRVTMEKDNYILEYSSYCWVSDKSNLSLMAENCRLEAMYSRFPEYSKASYSQLMALSNWRLALDNRFRENNKDLCMFRQACSS